MLAQNRAYLAHVGRAEQGIAGDFAEARRQRLPAQQGPRNSLSMVPEVMEQYPAVAEFLLELQCIHVRKPQLGRGLLGRPLHDSLERGKLRGHTGRRQKHIAFGAVVERRRAAGAGTGGRPGYRTPVPARRGAPRPAGWKRSVPYAARTRARRRAPASLVTTPMDAAKGQHFGPGAAAALDEIRALPRGAQRGKGQTWPPVSDLPRQFLAPPR